MMFIGLLSIFYCLTSAAVFNVLNYGAVGDGTTLNTKAISSAITAAKQAGGSSTLYFPSGKYLTGPFNLTSNMQLSLDPAATILAVPDMTQFGIVPAWPSYGTGRDTNTGPDNYEPFIGAYNAQNVSITGGTIDGQGQYWWDLYRAKQLHHSRPVLVQFQWCDGVKVTNTLLRNSPFWNLHPLYTNDVYIADMTILAPQTSPNTDGIDVDSSTNVLIERVTVTNGDDMIAIKSGFNMPGILYGKPSANVIIRDSVFANGHGISVGSETSGGVRNITFENCEVTNAVNGPRVKTSRGRGGIIQDIVFKNITVRNCYGSSGVVMSTGMNYDNIPNPGNATTTPIVRDITISDVRSTQCSKPGSFICLPESHCTGFSLQDIDLVGVTGSFSCQYITGKSMNVSPASCIQP